MKREATQTQSEREEDSERQSNVIEAFHFSLAIILMRKENKKEGLCQSLSLRNNGIKMSNAIKGGNSRLFLTQLNGGTTNYTRKKEEKEKRQFSQLVLGEGRTQDKTRMVT